MPVRETIRLGIPRVFYEDLCNHVLACSGSNGFDNRHTIDGAPQPTWDLPEFLSLRDRVFARRRERIAACRARERAFFEGRPWRRAAGNAGGGEKG